MYKYENKCYASFEGMTVNEGRLFFSEWSNNEIYKYDYSTLELEYICQIKEELGERLFSALGVCGNNIYLVPFSANSFYEVDIDTGQYHEIFNFEKDYKKGKAYLLNSKMMGIHIMGDNIYVMPAAFPGILKYNRKDKYVEVLDSWVDTVEKLFGTEDPAFSRGTIQYNQKIYIPLCNGNGILIWDTLKDEYEIKIISGVYNGFSDICYDGSSFWLSSRYKDKLIIWNKDRNYINVISNELFSNITRIEYYRDYIYLFPQNNGSIVKVCANNVNELNIEMINAEASILSSYSEKEHIFWFDFNRGELFIDGISRRIPHLDILELKHNKLFSQLYYSLNTIGNISSDKIYYEDYTDALLDFIQNIK